MVQNHQRQPLPSPAFATGNTRPGLYLWVLKISPDCYDFAATAYAFLLRSKPHCIQVNVHRMAAYNKCNQRPEIQTQVKALVSLNWLQPPE